MSAGTTPAQDSAGTEPAGDPEPTYEESAGIPVAAVQRRTLAALAVTQVFGGIGVSAAIAVNALLAKQVSGSEQLAGVAQTFQVLGAAVATAIIAQLTHARGRRVGLAAGYALGAAGAATSAVAGILGSFPLLLVGAMLIGSITAAGGQIRYAATDLAAPHRRGRDLSLVVWATTIGSGIGPNLGGPGALVAERLGLPRLTGAYLFTFAGAVVAIAVMTVLLRPDPLLLARRLAAQRQGTPGSAAPAAPVVSADSAATAGLVAPADGAAPASRSRWDGWLLVARSPVLRAAAVGLALSHAVMVAVMVMTPIHMDHGQATLEIIGLVISIHVLGMFALSPLVGLLVDRAGPVAVLAAGGGVLLLALALAGTSSPGHSARLTVGLGLLGVGWSLAQIAASTLVTAATAPATRPLVQGATDVLTFSTAALAGAVAGLVVGGPGYAALNALSAVFAAAVVGAAVAARRARRHTG